MAVTHMRVRNDGLTQGEFRAVADALARIGDKWTVMIVGALKNGPMRYNAIRRTTDGISQRMLTLTLKALERDGLVTRTMYPTIPPRVDYELTDLGSTLIAPLAALHQWVLEHGEQIEAARNQYDSERQQPRS